MSGVRESGGMEREHDGRGCELKLKAAELQAKKDRLKIWTTYVPPQTNSTAILDVNFSGKVRVGRNCGWPSFSWVADG